MKQLNEIVAENCQGLSSFDKDFLLRMYASGLDVYRNRLQAVGFDSGSILDAGCGFGQWSLSMAELGAEVTSVDISTARTDFLQRVADQWIPGRVAASARPLGDLSFEDDSFDKVFCYGVLFLTPWKESLREMLRVLRPGGELYVNANGFGWYKNLWYNEPNKTEGYDPAERAAKVLLNTWNYKHGRAVEPGLDILVEPEELRLELEALGARDFRQAGEGLLRAPGREGVEAQPFFQAEYHNDLGVYEALVTKG